MDVEVARHEFRYIILISLYVKLFAEWNYGKLWNILRS